MRSWIIAVALLVSFSQGVAAKTLTNKVEAKELGGALRFDRLQEGLPPGRVDAIAQDAVGFMWIGTEGGLARFDGQDFARFGEENADETGFTGTNVTALASATSGMLWIGTAEKGLFSYDTEHDAFTSVEAPLGNSISSLLADTKGRLWVGYATGGLSILEAGAWVDSKSDIVVVSMREGKDGYWLATRGSGLLRVSDFGNDADVYSTTVGTDFGPEFSEKRYLNSDALTDVVVDTDGSVWVATVDAGLNHLNPATGEISHYQSSDSSNSLISDALSMLAIDKRGNLWVGSLQGVSMYVRKTDEFKQFRQDSTNQTSLGDDWVSSIAVDSGGVVWFGHMTNGVSKTHPSRLAVELYRTEAKTPVSMAVDADGVLWVGVFNSGLWAFDRKHGRLQIVRSLHNEEFDLKFTENLISSIVVQGDQLWLTSATAGLIHFQPSTGAFEVFNSTNSALPSERLWSSALDAQGNLWLGSEAEGLIRFNTENGQVEAWMAGELNGLASDQVMVVHMDEDGQHLWVGTPDGLLRLNTKTLKTQSSYELVEGDETSLPSSQINAVWQNGNSLWIATDAGVGELSISTGKVRRFTRAQGLSNDMVYGVIESDGAVWLSTNGGGLQRLDPATSTFETYREQDGFQGNEYAMNSYYKTPTGELIFGGTKGFNIFSPNTIERPDNLGPLVITGVEVANKPYKFSKSSWNSKIAAMDHSSGIIQFRFSSLGYSAPDVIRYRYRLTPIFKKWTEVEADKSFATYTNLSGGDYTFEVMAQSASGDWTEATKMKLDVAPPFYLTWWAFAIEGLIVLVLVLLYLKYQRERLNAAIQETHLQKVEKDLELTGAIQAGFLPEEIGVSTDSFEILGFYRPAESCSGDWWWFEQEADGRYAILVGDVTGHGPGPAMVTAAVATAYRVQSLAGGDIEERLRVINSEVLRVSRGKYQMTLTAMVVDIMTGEYTIYSAGGLPVMSQEHSGATVRSLPCRGTPLGTEQVLIGSMSGTLSPGTRVILYTDGIPETDMPNGKQLGMRRFAKLFGDTMEMALPLASRHLVDMGDNYREDRPQDDDWTFVIAQWRGPGDMSVDRRGQ